MNLAEKAHLPFAAHTDPGKKGKNNEDNFSVSAFELENKDHSPVLLAVLSDGIGGHRAGEVASMIAVHKVSEFVSRSDGDNPQNMLREAIGKASDEIFEQAQGAPERSGMGATCSCIYICNNRLYTATVGDSRIYLIRNGAIQQISIDHTWIQEALDGGLIRPDQVVGHPNAHVIRRYLGGPKVPNVDLRMRLSNTDNDHQAEANQGIKLHAGDFVLTCSDGLTDLVKAPEILSLILSKPDLNEAVHALVDLANERGGHDNITVVLIKIPPAYQLPAKSADFPLFVWLGCAGIAVFLAGTLFFAFWFRKNINDWFTSPAPTLTQTFSPLLTQTPTTTITPTAASTSTNTPSSTINTADPSITAKASSTLVPTMTISPTSTVKPSSLNHNGTEQPTGGRNTPQSIQPTLAPPTVPVFPTAPVAPIPTAPLPKTVAPAPTIAPTSHIFHTPKPLPSPFIPTMKPWH